MNFPRHRLASVLIILTVTIFLPACSTTPDNLLIPIKVKVNSVDKFSYANFESVKMTHLDLDLDVNFNTKTLSGFASIDFERTNPSAKQIVLDTKDLRILSVEAGPNWKKTNYTLGEKDPVLGKSMVIDLPEDATQLRIQYSTSPTAEGLQWLSPAQTAGKKHPFLFSQAQAINARTIAPVQDTPAVRITYNATLRTPPELLALMSAGQDPYTPRDGEYEFSMPQPIPAYLLAIAVGDVNFKPINDHIGVYAEDYILDDSVAEFEDTPMMEDATAALYGPYQWGRYDLIVLPPSFPYGGMENPRLSFITPTLVAGDKSLTNVVAHELAHSWSGNLVTNSNWRDAWLNEGFTSYVENRIMEALYGKNRAVMEQALSLEDLKRDVSQAERPELTQLKLPADIEHPDEAFTQVAYIKGQFFLMFLEERFGRDNFDRFLKSYFDHFSFQSVTTEDFITYLHDNLHVNNPSALSKAELQEWVYGQGIPTTAATPVSDAFDKVEAQSQQWQAGEIPTTKITVADWSTHEWLHFINNLPQDLTQQQFKELDAAFQFTGHKNAEIAFAWYMQAIKGSYWDVKPKLREFLIAVGRGKFIYRLYDALNENKTSQEFGLQVYEQARPGYHPIAQRRISQILGEPTN